MFEKNKILWFILVAGFGLSVAILGAHDLRERMLAKKGDAKLPDAKKIIEDLKQANTDPFQSMLAKGKGSEKPVALDQDSQRAQAKRAEVKEVDLPTEASSLSETLGVDQFLKMFDSASTGESSKSGPSQ